MTCIYSVTVLISEQSWAIKKAESFVPTIMDFNDQSQIIIVKLNDKNFLLGINAIYIVRESRDEVKYVGEDRHV